VVCGDDVSTHKPDSAGLVEILRQLALDPAAALYMGDADVDVLGGVGAGVDTILISHARTPETGIATQAWRSVRSPFEAYEWALNCTTR
jgi:phosphoglycolate phosphatase-like HAD superfamily hydrolase